MLVNYKQTLIMHYIYKLSTSRLSNEPSHINGMAKDIMHVNQPT